MKNKQIKQLLAITITILTAAQSTEASYFNKRQEKKSIVERYKTELKSKKLNFFFRINRDKSESLLFIILRTIKSKQNKLSNKNWLKTQSWLSKATIVAPLCYKAYGLYNRKKLSYIPIIATFAGGIYWYKHTQEQNIKYPQKKAALDRTINELHATIGNTELWAMKKDTDNNTNQKCILKNLPPITSSNKIHYLRVNNEENDFIPYINDELSLLKHYRDIGKKLAKNSENKTFDAALLNLDYFINGNEQRLKNCINLVNKKES